MQELNYSRNFDNIVHKPTREYKEVVNLNMTFNLNVIGVKDAALLYDDLNDIIEQFIEEKNNE